MNKIAKIETWMKYERYLFAALFAFALILAFLYVYFVNVAILKTAERNANLKKLTEVKVGLRELESSYLDTFNQLNLSYAQSLGFTEATPDKFIYRQKSVAQNTDYGKVFR